MPTLYIRRARLTDATELGELDRAVWSTLHSVAPRPMPPYGPFFRSDDETADYLVAETGTGTGTDAGSAADAGTGARTGGEAREATETANRAATAAPIEVGSDAERRAERISRISGYIRIRKPIPLPCNSHVRAIQGLAVASWARGQGVGRALLRAAADEARRQGATRITLRVLGHNTPARRLYASEGYTVEGVLPGEFYLAGRYVDDVLMGRSLSR